MPVVSGAPANEATRPLSEALKETQAQVPLNPQGGLLMAQRFAPLSYEDYVDLLAGKSWKGIEHGKQLISFDGVVIDWNANREIHSAIRDVVDRQRG